MPFFEPDIPNQLVEMDTTADSRIKPASVGKAGGNAATRYVVITPVRNEAAFLNLLVDSLVVQTVTPQQWIIVDDGSTDGTADLATAAARNHSWISVVRRSNRGYREPGGGVIQAFCDGFRLINADWEFVVKLDGDVSF